MSNKHTPGPWQLHYDVSDFSVTANDGEERVSYVGSEANAKLIAAAPELLEACIKARSAFLTSEPEYDLLTEVIEKATGHKYPETTP